MYSVTLWESFQGSVFGITAMEVNPPAAAAALPVSIVSSSSRPGSRRWTCMSMKPGATTLPERSSTFTLSAGRPSPTRAILPSLIRTSLTASSLAAGSTTRPPLSSQFTGGASREQVQDRHSHRHPVSDLIQDDRVRPVGHLGGDLHSPIHRTRMHHDGVGLRALEALQRQAVEVEILAQRGEGPVPHPLRLHAQHHHNVDSF